MNDSTLETARALARIGMPVWRSKLSKDGGPIREKWQDIKVDVAERELAAWQPGMAMCATAGVVFDVLDRDPKNDPGSRSWNRLLNKLGPDGLDYFFRVRTPSGGEHYYIATLGLGRKYNPIPGFPGVDLQSSNSLVFLPPTQRKGGAYVVLENALGEFSPRPCKALKKLILSSVPVGGAVADERAEVSDLRRACIEAPEGSQRAALLRLVHEYERKGYDREDIVLLLLQLNIRNYNPSSPWNARSFRSLFHRAGAVIADARPGELDGIEEPIRAGRVRALDGVEAKITRWLWKPFLARGEISLLDGEKGVGKSSSWFDIAARGSRGAAMPGDERQSRGAFSTLILSPENRTEQIIVPRLRAAGADLSRIFMPAIGVQRGKRMEDKMLLLPDSAETIGGMIRESGASLLIIDPVPAFLMPTINSHNDASVRTALAPLAAVLGRLDCAAGFSRNMNKNSSQEARHRGSGSQAFADLARVHIVMMRLPPDAGVPGQFGFSQAVANMTRHDSRVLTFSIEDSDIPLDEEVDGDGPSYVSRLVWHGYQDVVLGGSFRRGPRGWMQEKIQEVLSDIFAEAGTSISPAEVYDLLRAAGASVNHATVDKVREDMGIIALPVHEKGKRGVKGWVWTNEIRVTRETRL